MAILPTRILEIEFDAGVWTDVTADLVDLSTRRGRNRESGAFETGTLTFTLRNDTRKYDPDNTAGTYYGKLRPNRRVRLRATYSAVTYPVFLGYIDRIAQVAGGPNDATATFTVSDIFKLLNRVDLPSSAYVAEVLADTPKALWRLDEPDGVTTVSDSSGNGYTLDVVGIPDFGQPSLISREPGSSVLMTSGAGQKISRQLTGGLPAAGPPMTLEIVFQRTVDGAAGGMVGQMCTSLTNGAFILATSGAVIVALAVNGNNAQTTALSTGVNLDDNLIHHIVARWAASGAIKIFVDGIDRTSGAPTCASVAFTDTAGSISAAAMPQNGLFTDPDTGLHQMAAIYNTELADARIANHAAQLATPWNGDLPGTRLGRIFDLAAVPAADRNIDAGTTTFQSTYLGGNALGYAQKVEETEAGRLFVAADGKIRFIGRSAAETGTYLTSQATLVDDDSGAGIPYRAADADVDEARIVTRATVSRDGSVAVAVYDAAAKTEFGWLDEVHDGLLHDSDSYSRSYAEWIVNTHKAPASRVGAVVMELTANPAAMYPAILALEIGQRVTWKRKAQNVGSVVSIDMRVEAISHETGGGYWRTSLQLSPFNLANNLPVFVWDTTKWDQHVWGI